MVVEMELQAAAAVARCDVDRARVKNRARLAYNAVAAWLDGEGPAPEAISRAAGVEEQVRIPDEVAQRLQGVRHEAGALVLHSVEARPVFADGTVVEPKAEKANPPKELI